MTSKFVGYFSEQVSSWQKKLSNADSVITIWMEVQRTWSHLESIFIGSEDIRAQLPEHSKTFDTIDEDFKVLKYSTCTCTEVASLWEINFPILCFAFLIHIHVHVIIISDIYSFGALSKYFNNVCWRLEISVVLV